jgi:RNA polymerase-binding transcription factor DksA
MTPTDQRDIGAKLRERRLALREEIRVTLLRADAERYANIADRIGEAEDHALAALLSDVSHAAVARDAGEISDIDLALQRMAAGTYGVCIACHASIPLDRLTAFPTAKRCLRCQQLHESRKN